MEGGGLDSREGREGDDGELGEHLGGGSVCGWLLFEIKRGKYVLMGNKKMCLILGEGEKERRRGKEKEDSRRRRGRMEG